MNILKGKKNLPHNHTAQYGAQIVDTFMLKYTNTLQLSDKKKRTVPTDRPYITLPAHYTCTHFTQMAWLFGKVGTLHVDIKGHLEDLLELHTVKD